MECDPPGITDMEVKMLSVLAVCAVLGVTLPLVGDTPTITAGGSIELEPENGEAWFRILEDDYVCLRVSVSGAETLAAFNEYGEPLCSASGGESMVLSAFSDYWFYIRASVPGGRGGLVTAQVDVVDPGILSNRIPVSSDLELASMARTFTFLPPESGRWAFTLEGSGGADLDLEIYGNRMSRWGSSLSLEASERIMVPALPGDSITIVVTRYGKTGSGEFTLEAHRVGDFPVLDPGLSSHFIKAGEAMRFLVEGSMESRFLGLTIGSPGADIDLVLRDTDGEYVMGSSSYSSLEAVVLPPGRETLVADMALYDAPDDSPVPFSVQLQELDEALPEPPLTVTVDAGSDRLRPVGFTSATEGFFLVSTVYEKLRDGDVLIFRNDGEPVLDFSTERGDEEFLIWAGAGDRMYVLPYFYSAGVTGEATVTVSELRLEPRGGILSGEVNDEHHAVHFLVPSPAGTILDVRLSADNREEDLDMLVSGPGLDLMAAGWFSNFDAAGNEAAAVYSEDDSRYGITVYLYERDGSSQFELSATTIESPPLAPGSDRAELWAVIAGISGYPTAADVLNRASMDAVEVFSFLRDEQGIEADHIVLLVDAMATAEAFREAVDAVLKTAGPEDMTLVFFSGHGFQLSPGSGGPEEGDSTNETICLYDEDVEDDWLASAIGNAESPVLLVLDACHSGGFVNDFSPDDNVLVLTAAREDLSVSERILTPIFLAGARGNADSDADGYISTLELMRYIDDRLQLICPECDAELDPNSFTCPDCGAVLKGENAVPRPQQGMFLDRDHELWPVTD